MLSSRYETRYSVRFSLIAAKVTAPAVRLVTECKCNLIACIRDVCSLPMTRMIVIGEEGTLDG